MANLKFLVEIKDSCGYLDNVRTEDYSIDELRRFLTSILGKTSFEVDIQKLKS